jgi:hypothetical protein
VRSRGDRAFRRGCNKGFLRAEGARSNIGREIPICRCGLRHRTVSSPPVNPLPKLAWHRTRRTRTKNSLLFPDNVHGHLCGFARKACGISLKCTRAAGGFFKFPVKIPVTREFTIRKPTGNRAPVFPLCRLPLSALSFASSIKPDAYEPDVQHRMRNGHG